MEEEFKDIKLEDIIGESNVKEEQYQEMLINIGTIMENLNGYPKELNKDVWDNKTYDSKFDYLDLQHEDITTLNTTKSLLNNILFKLIDDDGRLDFYGRILSYYFNVDEEDAVRDILEGESKHSEDAGYKYALKLIHYKENNKGVPGVDD